MMGLGRGDRSRHPKAGALCGEAQADQLREGGFALAGNRVKPGQLAGAEPKLQGCVAGGGSHPPLGSCAHAIGGFLNGKVG